MALYPVLMILRHTDHDHFEEWYDAGEGQVFVTSDCPANYPTNSSHFMSTPQALRQFALMTSTEGWVLLEDHGWHDYVEALDIE